MDESPGDMQPAESRVHQPATGAGSKARRLSSSSIQSMPPHNDFESNYHYFGTIPFKQKKVGKGATADVRLCVRAHDPKKEVLAIKVFNAKPAEETDIEYAEKLYSEFKITESVRHPNVISVFDLVIDKHKHWSHVMEYCAGGDLFALITKDFMGLPEKLCCFKQVLRGVAYLHAHGIVHRDIKPENLLMTPEGMLKITDFGVSDKVEQGILSRGFCGSEPYMSPEIFSEAEYDARKLDAWSCGVVLYTLLLSGAPFNKPVNDDPMYRRYLKDYETAERHRRRDNEEWEEACARAAHEGKPEPAPPSKDHIPRFPPFEWIGEQDRKCKRLLAQLLRIDPATRVTAEEAVKSDWVVRGIDCCCADIDEAADSHEAGMDATKPNACKRASGLHVRKPHRHLPEPKGLSRQNRAATGRF